jgi:hypothetical protein
MSVPKDFAMAPRSKMDTRACFTPLLLICAIVASIVAGWAQAPDDGSGGQTPEQQRCYRKPHRKDGRRLCKTNRR